MTTGAANNQPDTAAEIAATAAPLAKLTKLRRIITTLKKLIQQYWRDREGQVFMSSNVKFDS